MQVIQTQFSSVSLGCAGLNFSHVHISGVGPRLLWLIYRIRGSLFLVTIPSEFPPSFLACRDSFSWFLYKDGVPSRLLACCTPLLLWG